MSEPNAAAIRDEPGVLWTRVVPALLLLLFAAQCAWFIGTQSITPDEPFHIDSGQDAWRDGQFKERDDNPPLVRLWFTALVTGPEYQFVKPPGQPVEAILPSPAALLGRTRGMNALLGVLLGAVLWWAARRLFSVGAANFTLGLYALSPAMIAHSSLATHDAPVTLMIFAAAYQLARWRANPSRLNTVGLGAVLGAMMAVKLNSPPMFGLATGVVLLFGTGRPWRVNPREWNWKAAILVTVVAGLVVWGSYFFHVSKVTLRDGHMTVNFPNFEWPLERDVPLRMNATFYVPAAEFFSGLINVAQHTNRGVEAFLLGESYIGGKRIYFPVVLGLKWPTIILGLAVFGGALLLLRRQAAPAGLGVMLLFPALYFTLVVISNVNLGDRHILPIYPFLLLLAAAVWEFARQRRGRALAWALVAAVLLQGADTARYAPDYLTYFNPFVDPVHSYRLLTDTCLDWGQGLVAMREYEAAHPDEKIYLAYFGNVNPQTAYGIRATPLRDGEYPSGTIVVSARHLSGYTHKDRWNYHWVEKYPRKAILAHVLHVFEVPPGAEASANAAESGKAGAQEVAKSESEDVKR